MRTPTYRKYPITYEKKNKTIEEPSSQTELIIDLSLSAAVGIVAFAFLKGVVFGYILGKK